MFRNKLLAYSFVVSIIVNGIFLILVGRSGLFQHADAIQDLRAQQIEVYKPPIPEKPHPQPKIKPPKPKSVPKALPRRPEVRPTPTFHAQPQPPQPAPVQNQKPQPHAAPQPAVLVKAAPQTSRPRSRPDPFVPLSPHTSVAPPVARPAVNIGSPSVHGTVATPPTIPAVVHTESPPPVAPQPVVQQPAPRPDPPAPVEQPRPKPKPELPDRGTPELIGSWDQLQLPTDYDPNTLTTTRVVGHWVVDKKGRAKNIKIPSCGNSDIDDAIRQFIQDHHYEPAVQNGEPQECQMDRTFVIGG